MDANARLDRLVAVGAVEEDAGGERLRLSAEFSEAVEEHREALSADGAGDVGDALAAAAADEETAAALRDLADGDADLGATLRALEARVDGPLDAGWLRLAPILDQLNREPPRSDGAPRSFLPVHGDRLDAFLRVYPTAVVYVWLDDCEPCDLMRDELDGVFAEPPDDVGLFAVYGPDYARELFDGYDVQGGPATLFVLDGEVDSRLYGAHPPEVLETELETLRDLAG